MEGEFRQEKSGSGVRHTNAYCSSTASIRYWLIVSILAWGLLTLIGIYWRPFRPESASTIRLAAAVGCFANWHGHRILHSGITGPVFVVRSRRFSARELAAYSLARGFRLVADCHRKRNRFHMGAALGQALVVNGI